MQIIGAIKAGFQRFRDFSGQSNRPDFWGFVLFMIAGGVAAHYFDAFVLGNSPSELGPVLLAFLAVTIIPYFACGARRLHAMGMSGWWQLIPVNLFLISQLLSGYVDFDKPFVQPSDWAMPGLLVGLLLVAVILQLLLVTWYSQDAKPAAMVESQAQDTLSPIIDLQAA